MSSDRAVVPVPFPGRSLGEVDRQLEFDRLMGAKREVARRDFDAGTSRLHFEDSKLGAGCVAKGQLQLELVGLPDLSDLEGGGRNHDPADLIDVRGGHFSPRLLHRQGGCQPAGEPPHRDERAEAEDTESEPSPEGE